MRQLLEQYDWVLFIAGGMGVTLKYAVCSVLGGIGGGLVISVLRLGENRLGNILAKIYVSVIRGTPIYLQLSLIYLALPSLIGYKLDISLFTAGMIAFSLNSGAYVSEIIRSGINGVDKGQWEAAKALGLSRYVTIKDIIIPQALVNTLPALVNESVNMVKESSIIAAFGELDLMRRAQIICSERYTHLAPYLVAGLCYYLIVLLLSTLANKLEEKISARGY